MSDSKEGRRERQLWLRDKRQKERPQAALWPGLKRLLFHPRFMRCVLLAVKRFFWTTDWNRMWRGMSSKAELLRVGGSAGWCQSASCLLLVRNTRSIGIQNKYLKLLCQIGIKIFMPIVCNNKKSEACILCSFEFHFSRNSFLLHLPNEFVHDRLETKLYCSCNYRELRSTDFNEHWLCQIYYYSWMQHLFRGRSVVHRTVVSMQRQGKQIDTVPETTWKVTVVGN